MVLGSTQSAVGHRCGSGRGRRGSRWPVGDPAGGGAGDARAIRCGSTCGFRSAIRCGTPTWAGPSTGWVTPGCRPSAGRGAGVSRPRPGSAGHHPLVRAGLLRRGGHRRGGHRRRPQGGGSGPASQPGGGLVPGCVRPALGARRLVELLALPDPDRERPDAELAGAARGVADIRRAEGDPARSTPEAVVASSSPPCPEPSEGPPAASRLCSVLPSGPAHRSPSIVTAVSVAVVRTRPAVTFGPLCGPFCDRVVDQWGCGA